jgi:hypothetical protein
MIASSFYRKGLEAYPNDPKEYIPGKGASILDEAWCQFRSIPADPGSNYKGISRIGTS